MKKSKKLALTMASLTLTGVLTGCVPEDDIPENVYGPPPSDDTGIITDAPEKDDIFRIPEILYASPEAMGEMVVPEENEPYDMYGPPSFEDEASEETAE